MKNFKHLTADEVQRNLAIQQQLVKESNPEIEVARGPFHDIVLYHSAIFAADNQYRVKEAMRLLSIGKLLKDPESVSQALADRVASNWLVKRKPGKRAHGLVTFVLNRAVPLNIPRGFILSVNGITFRTDDSYTIRPAGGSTILPNDRILSVGCNQFTFTIPVTANSIGSVGNIRRGTKLRIMQDFSPHIVKVAAAKDFTGGVIAESNTQLLSRLTQGITAKTLSSRPTLTATVHKQSQSHRPPATSIIGFGDQEMIRDKHAVWPGSTGGRVDVYVRPSGPIIGKTVPVLGHKIERTPAGTTWEIKIPRNIACGFYYLAGIKTLNGKSCKVLSDVRGFDVGDLSSTLSISKPEEAAYSAFQTTTLVIIDTSPDDYTIEREFAAELRYLPGIELLQEQLAHRDLCTPAGDLLVKLPVPCLVSVNLEFCKLSSDNKIKTDLIRKQVTEFVNDVSFKPCLSAADMSKEFSAFLSGGTFLKQTTLKGKIIYPDGKIVTLESNTALVVPNDPLNMVSPRTVAFFLDPEDIHIKFNMVDGYDEQVV
jgi:hypothetical protein